ncbi:MAG: hypothetical protein WA783_22775 [Phormidesmis sp.]
MVLYSASDVVNSASRAVYNGDSPYDVAKLSGYERSSLNSL